MAGSGPVHRDEVYGDAENFGRGDVSLSIFGVCMKSQLVPQLDSLITIAELGFYPYHAELDSPIRLGR